MQLGGSHDHPITLHIRSGAAFGNDFGLAGVPRSKRHEPHRQPKLRSRFAGKVTFKAFSVTKKTDKSSPVFTRDSDEKLHGADVKGHPTGNRP
jgi:hypothetical protein